MFFIMSMITVGGGRFINMGKMTSTIVLVHKGFVYSCIGLSCAAGGLYE